MNKRNVVYLDYNATTPVDDRVVKAMLPYFREKFGNSGSDHLFGWDASEAVEFSREQVANLVNCKPSEIIFTSGATEAANICIQGYCESNRSKGNHIVTCKTEHKAILDTINSLEQRGFEVTYLDVDKAGNIDLQELKDSITPETILVSIMLANNETGIIHPIREIAEVVHSKGTILMSDITQVVGKIPVDLKDLNIDIAIFSSHKLYGPKGIGALYINKQNKLSIEAVLYGGGQEKGFRPGTLNVPGIVGFGKACEIISLELVEEYSRMESQRNLLEDLLDPIDGISFNSKEGKRLPNTSSVSFKNIRGDQLIRKLSAIAVSRGSACTANTQKPSHVLKAMGHSDELALSSLRISLGRGTKVDDIEFAASEIKKVLEILKTVEA